MPSGSRPLTGSSHRSTCGSPSSAAAMPRRWLMPSENPLARRRRTSCSPTRASTSSTRCRPMPLLCARQSRWLNARAPAVHGPGVEHARRPRAAAGDAARTAGRARAPCRCVGWSRPRIMRIVVDLPAPFGPRKPVTRPGRTSKDRSSTASVRPVSLRQAACLDHRCTTEIHMPEYWARRAPCTSVINPDMSLIRP